MPTWIKPDKTEAELKGMQIFPAVASMDGGDKNMPVVGLVHDGHTVVMSIREIGHVIALLIRAKNEAEAQFQADEKQVQDILRSNRGRDN